MAVSITTQVTITIEGLKPWIIPESLLKEAEGRRFIRLPGSNSSSLLRLIMKKKPPKGMSLSQCNGLKLMKEKRNAAQEKVFACASESAATDFFEVPAESRRKKRLTKQLQIGLRESPEIVDAILDDDDKTVVPMLRPSHPTDDVWIELLPDKVAYALNFIRQHLDSVPEASPRDYNKHEPGQPKVWKMGLGRTAVINKGEPLQYVAMPADEADIEDEDARDDDAPCASDDEFHRPCSEEAGNDGPVAAVRAASISG